MNETSSPSPPMGQRERRQHRRIALDWPLSITLEDGTYEARLRDISKAGVCFFLDRRVPEMTVLGMRVELPAVGDTSSSPSAGQNAVQGSGVVVRCKPLSKHLDHYEIAVFLNDLSESDREALEAYVAGQGD